MNTTILFLLCSLAATALGKVAKNPRIVGGTHAAAGEFPWQGNLQLLSGSSWYNLCGCVLYSNNKALTAAHCISAGASSYRAVFGLRSITIEDGTEQESAITAITNHPDFDAHAAGYPNDLAILTLTTPMDVSGSTVNTIPLASPSGISDFDGQSCVVTGWGSEADTGPKSDILKKVNMTILTNIDCIVSWAGVGGAVVNDGHVCGFEAGTNACHGDNGGALVCGNTLAGITSWGMTSCDGNHPTVFSRVSYFYDWIQGQ